MLIETLKYALKHLNKINKAGKYRIVDDEIVFDDGENKFEVCKLEEVQFYRIFDRLIIVNLGKEQALLTTSYPES